MKKMIFENIFKKAENDASEFAEINGQNSLRPPSYNAESYVDDVVQDKYFAALTIVRHYVKLTSDVYWSENGAYNIEYRSFYVNTKHLISDGTRI